MVSRVGEPREQQMRRVGRPRRRQRQPDQQRDQDAEGDGAARTKEDVRASPYEIESIVRWAKYAQVQHGKRSESDRQLPKGCRLARLDGRALEEWSLILEVAGEVDHEEDEAGTVGG